MLDTFIPLISPSPGTGRKTDFKILEADFGDGYSQPVADGLNNAKRTLSLAWNILNDDQAWDISDFLTRQKGATPFYYTPPREDYPVKWTCRDFTDDVQDFGYRKITATFVQSFTLQP